MLVGACFSGGCRMRLSGISNLLPHSARPSLLERCGGGEFLEVCVCRVLETGCCPVPQEKGQSTLEIAI